MSSRYQKATGQSWRPLLQWIAVAIFLHACMASKGWWNPIVERHGWRQTQTALTAFWIARGSPLLNYETPVFGPPWNFPLEFPLYQWAVALMSRSTSIPIDQCGRVISLLSFYAGLLPVAWMVRRLWLPRAVFGAFAICYLASPLYLFWSRTVLIETTAMTLSLGYFVTGIVSLRRPFRWGVCISCLTLGMLAALVKITTFAGALLSLSLLYAALSIRRRRVSIIAYGLLPLIFPMVAGLSWAWYSDISRAANPLQFMANDEMNRYNFGPLALRASLDYWRVFGFRMLGDVLGKLWGAVLLVSILATIRWSKGRLDVATLAAVGFCTGPLVFANLYYIHDYYPNGAAAYLYLALALLWGLMWTRGGFDRKLSVVAASLFVVGAAYNYFRLFYPDLTAANNSFVNTARFLKPAVPPNDVLIIYGADWDPSIPYYSEHRAIMDRLYRSVESPQLENALDNLAKGQHVGAIVACYEANQGWYQTRVLATVSATGMSPVPVYQDNVCRAYLPATDGRPSSGAVILPDMSWIAMPALGGTPRAPQLRNPLLERLSLIPIQGDSMHLAAIEGPDGSAAILANPASRLSLELPAHASSVRLGFGVKAYAWRTRDLPPVSFELSIGGEDGRTILWNRLINPAHCYRDRGVQHTEVTIPRGVRQVILETFSQNAATVNRAYWSSIEVR